MEGAGDDLDQAVEAALGVGRAVALVLDGAEVERDDVAAEAVGEVAGGAAVAGAQVQDGPAGAEVVREAVGEALDGTAGGIGDGLGVVVVDAGVDVLAAPDGVVEGVDVGGFVVAAGGVLIVAQCGLGRLAVVAVLSSFMCAVPSLVPPPWRFPKPGLGRERRSTVPSRPTGRRVPNRSGGPAAGEGRQPVSPHMKRTERSFRRSEAWPPCGRRVKESPSQCGPV
ncbi:hypothetical protein GCM10010349_44350 [Streptomyces flavofungini]|nr:hypothetical protein GCM10010349_44350 [Streptomyces flavofungini]